MLTIAGALSLILGAGLGAACAIGIHHLAVTGEAWTQFGFPARGRGPFEQAGIRASIPPGAGFRGRSRPGWLRWNRTCEILAVGPPRQTAWRTIPAPLFVAGTHWRITLEPVGARATKHAGHPDHRCDDGAAAGTLDHRGRLR